MKTISILNLKGGVAKTFTAANMAYELYRRGYKVLLIDNDKQGNLSKAYSRYDAENVAPVTRLLAGDWESADELIQHTEYEGIDIVTANMSLFGATWNLTKEDSENQIERYKALVTAKVLGFGYAKFDYIETERAYDYCIIDNPPDIGLNVVNALAITDEVIVPVLYEFDLQIECLNPFWREEEETKEDIASWVAAWHFPCVIEKDSTKSMIYGYRAESVIVDCYNEGDVSTGMRIRFTALGTVSNPILLNVDTEEFIQINATMKTGDVIEINTKYGSKGAKLIRDGVETDYFRYIDVDSTFMQLAIGDNMFRYDAASGVNSLEVSIFYSKEFLGV